MKIFKKALCIVLALALSLSCLSISAFASSSSSESPWPYPLFMNGFDYTILEQTDFNYSLFPDNDKISILTEDQSKYLSTYFSDYFSCDFSDWSYKYVSSELDFYPSNSKSYLYMRPDSLYATFYSYSSSDSFGDLTFNSDYVLRGSGPSGIYSILNGNLCFLNYEYGSFDYGYGYKFLGFESDSSTFGHQFQIRFANFINPVFPDPPSDDDCCAELSKHLDKLETLLSSNTASIDEIQDAFSSFRLCLERVLYRMAKRIYIPDWYFVDRPVKHYC